MPTHFEAKEKRQSNIDMVAHVAKSQAHMVDAGERRRKLREMFEDGEPIAAIGEALGISRQRADQLSKEMGLQRLQPVRRRATNTKPNRKLSDEAIIRIKASLVAGKYLPDVAGEFGITPGHLRGIAKGHIWREVGDSAAFRRWQANYRGNAKKLTVAKVAQIRALLLQGAVRNQLAKRFGVTHRIIVLIAEGKLWKGVEAA